VCISRYSFTTEYKLRHDIEQLELIAELDPAKSKWLLQEVAAKGRK
jgi:hypothetical protein